MIKFGINSECDHIQSVVISCPKVNYSRIKTPNDVMHNEKISYSKLAEEFSLYINLLRSLNIEVHRTDDFLEFNTNESYFNMIYSRDLAVVTNEGIIIPNMYYEVRKLEPIKMISFFNELNVPILNIIKGESTLEGADVLWVKEDVVLVGVGNRTNISGFNEIDRILKQLKVKAIPVQVPNGIQHLLGVMNVISKDTVMMRTDIVSRDLYNILKSLGYKIISIKECDEVTYKQSMNIVTVNSNEIIMPDDCPKTEKIFKDNGIYVHKTPIKELRKGAGGLACATLILKRNIC